MKRRVFFGAFSSLVGLFTARFKVASASGFNPANPDTALQNAIKSLPFEHFEVTGADSAIEWQRLRLEGRGWPIVVGGDRDLIELAELRSNQSPADRDAVLERASKLKHPDSLRARRAEDDAASTAHLKELLKRSDTRLPTLNIIGPDGARQVDDAEMRAKLDEALSSQQQEPEIGEWPETASDYGLAMALDGEGRPLPRIHILLIPTANGADVPAYLPFGGWNECPMPEFHVAALRAWSERYGAVLVGLNADTMILYVDSRPRSRQAALDLAREQFLYCEDNVLQGTGTLAPQAASLMATNWWYFWWD